MPQDDVSKAPGKEESLYGFVQWFFAAVGLIMVVAS